MSTSYEPIVALAVSRHRSREARLREAGFFAVGPLGFDAAGVARLWVKRGPCAQREAPPDKPMRLSDISPACGPFTSLHVLPPGATLGQRLGLERFGATPLLNLVGGAVLYAVPLPAEDAQLVAEDPGFAKTYSPFIPAEAGAPGVPVSSKPLVTDVALHVAAEGNNEAAAFWASDGTPYEDGWLSAGAWSCPGGPVIRFLFDTDEDDEEEEDEETQGSSVEDSTLTGSLLSGETGLDDTALSLDVSAATAGPLPPPPTLREVTAAVAARLAGAGADLTLQEEANSSSPVTQATWLEGSVVVSLRRFQDVLLLPEVAAWVVPEDGTSPVAPLGAVGWVELGGQPITPLVHSWHDNDSTGLAKEVGDADVDTSMASQEALGWQWEGAEQLCLPLALSAKSSDAQGPGAASHTGSSPLVPVLEACTLVLALAAFKGATDAAPVVLGCARVPLPLVLEAGSGGRPLPALQVTLTSRLQFTGSGADVQLVALSPSATPSPANEGIACGKLELGLGWQPGPPQVTHEPEPMLAMPAVPLPPVPQVADPLDAQLAAAPPAAFPVFAAPPPQPLRPAEVKVPTSGASTDDTIPPAPKAAMVKLRGLLAPVAAGTAKTNPAAAASNTAVTTAPQLLAAFLRRDLASSGCVSVHAAAEVLQSVPGMTGDVLSGVLGVVQALRGADGGAGGNNATLTILARRTFVDAEGIIDYVLLVDLLAAPDGDAAAIAAAVLACRLRRRLSEALSHRLEAGWAFAATATPAVPVAQLASALVTTLEGRGSGASPRGTGGSGTVALAAAVEALEALGAALTSPAELEAAVRTRRPEAVRSVRSAGSTPSCPSITYDLHGLLQALLCPCPAAGGAAATAAAGGSSVAAAAVSVSPSPTLAVPMLPLASALPLTWREEALRLHLRAAPLIARHPDIESILGKLPGALEAPTAGAGGSIVVLEAAALSEALVALFDVSFASAVAATSASVLCLGPHGLSDVLAATGVRLGGDTDPAHVYIDLSAFLSRYIDVSDAEADGIVARLRSHLDLETQGTTAGGGTALRQRYEAVVRHFNELATVLDPSAAFGVAAGLEEPENSSIGREGHRLSLRLFASCLLDCGWPLTAAEALLLARRFKVQGDAVPSTAAACVDHVRFLRHIFFPRDGPAPLLSLGIAPSPAAAAEATVAVAATVSSASPVKQQPASSSALASPSKEPAPATAPASPASVPTGAASLPGDIDAPTVLTLLLAAESDSERTALLSLVKSHRRKSGVSSEVGMLAPVQPPRVPAAAAPTPTPAAAGAAATVAPQPAPDAAPLPPVPASSDASETAAADSSLRARQGRRMSASAAARVATAHRRRSRSAESSGGQHVEPTSTEAGSVATAAVEAVDATLAGGIGGETEAANTSPAAVATATTTATVDASLNNNTATDSGAARRARIRATRLAYGVAGGGNTAVLPPPAAIAAATTRPLLKAAPLPPLVCLNCGFSNAPCSASGTDTPDGSMALPSACLVCDTALRAPGLEAMALPSTAAVGVNRQAPAPYIPSRRSSASMLFTPAGLPPAGGRRTSVQSALPMSVAAWGGMGSGWDTRVTPPATPHGVPGPARHDASWLGLDSPSSAVTRATPARWGI